MTQPGADPLVGRTVAHYEIVARLGGGGMGVVYRAIDRKLGRPVALKFLPPQWSHDEAAKQRFLREAQAASATDHPNICTIHDIATADDGQLFIVMAHYAGETLKQRLDRGPLSIDESLDIATQVADGLARAHAQGIVHRDVKPGNLILTEDGVRIVDFGLATFVDALQLTVQGSTLGTAAYMSPEQVRGGEVDARTDVWAVGVVLYQMLAGHPPFRGAYAEAIGYAIRNDPPPPLRAERPDIPEDVEQLVFRALHKDVAIRFASGRELARALRLARGMTVPQDLRTQVIAYEPARPTVGPAPRPRTFRSRTIAVGILLAAAAIGAPASLLIPVTRVPIVIAPVVNETGERPLDDGRMALAHLVTGQLADSPHVRVLPYERVLSILRAYRAEGKGVTSPGAVQALETHSGAAVIVIPTLMYEDGAYTARIQFRIAGAGTDHVEETAPIPSSLPGDAAFKLTRDVATAVERRFAEIGPTRGYVAAWLRNATGRTAPKRPHARTFEAATAFERGVDANEQQEYHLALQSFTAAAKLDSGNALFHAWVGRAAQAMSRPNDAATAAVTALAVRTADMPVIAGLLVDAMAAESRGEFAAAREHYSTLARRFPDEPAWLAERAALLERQGDDLDGAITDHIAALSLDSGLARSELALCRLYNRKTDVTRARERARRAADRFSTLGDRGGEAQARLCLADALRQGTAAETAEARRHADAALQAFSAAGAAYNVARARHYVALAAEAQGDLKVAADSWEQALAETRAVGNADLEAAVINNLGVNFERLGNPVRALEFYEAGYTFHGSQGNEDGATASLANVGTIRIRYGGDRERGLREVENALVNIRKAGAKSFEVLCLQAKAAYQHWAGDYPDAERLLLQAEAIATSNDLQNKLESIAIDLARLALDRGDYASARDRLTATLEAAAAAGPAAAEIRILLAQTQIRLGDVISPAAHLASAEATIRQVGEMRLLPLLYLAAGELAFATGSPNEARQHFARSAGSVTDALRDPASVKASGYLQDMAKGTIQFR